METVNIEPHWPGLLDFLYRAARESKGSAAKQFWQSFEEVRRYLDSPAGRARYPETEKDPRLAAILRETPALRAEVAKLLRQRHRPDHDETAHVRAAHAR